MSQTIDLIPNKTPNPKIDLLGPHDLPDNMSSPNDHQVPKYLNAEIEKIGVNRYRVIWSTDLVTKGKVTFIGKRDNNLVLISDKGKYLYDHSLKINLSGFDKGFSVKIESVYLTGTRCVTFINPDETFLDK